MQNIAILLAGRRNLFDLGRWLGLQPFGNVRERLVAAPALALWKKLDKLPTLNLTISVLASPPPMFLAKLAGKGRSLHAS